LDKKRTAGNGQNNFDEQNIVFGDVPKSDFTLSQFLTKRNTQK